MFLDGYHQNPGDTFSCTSKHMGEGYVWSALKNEAVHPCCRILTLQWPIGMLLGLCLSIFRHCYSFNPTQTMEDCSWSFWWGTAFWQDWGQSDVLYLSPWEDISPGIFSEVKRRSVIWGNHLEFGVNMLLSLWYDFYIDIKSLLYFTWFLHYL